MKNKPIIQKPAVIFPDYDSLQREKQKIVIYLC